MGSGGSRVVVIILLAAAFSGCVEAAQHLAGGAAEAFACIDVAAAQSEPQVFQYGGAVACRTASERHAWSNPSIYADVQWGGALASGALSVRVLDAAGREVYAFELDDGGSTEGAQGRTAAGFPSMEPITDPWTVELEFTNFTGTMGLQLFASSPPALAGIASPVQDVCAPSVDIAC